MGKSTLGKRLGVRLVRASKPVIIYDPRAHGTGQNISGWTGYVTNDFHRFEQLFWANKSGVAFIDEAGEVFAKHPNQAQPMLTAGRHIDPVRGGGGHVVFMLAHRFVGFDKTAREQVDRGFIFRVSREEAKAQAQHWGIDVLTEAYRLPKLHYFQVDTAGNVQLGRLTF